MPTLRILLADDNHDCLQSLARLLQLMGHEVATVDRGEAVFAEAARQQPHLILIDLGMPGVSGYDVARQLRGSGAIDGARIVALSGFAMEEDKRKALSAGFDGHIPKPMTLATLECLLDRIAQTCQPQKAVDGAHRH
jgi:CheY-like chemotaxis protein